ncbi:MAG: flagellar biosynthetic protein FliQ [Polyangiaceae bacterium]|nr:flagellar biosynthetic protein FliQ [Polyangiaceae bacterium]
MIELLQKALFLSLAIGLPVLLVAAFVGFVVAAISSAMQIQDPTLSHLPRVISVTVALMLLGPWMAHELSQFTREVFTQSIAAQR